MSGENSLRKLLLAGVLGIGIWACGDSSGGGGSGGATSPPAGSGGSASGGNSAGPASSGGSGAASGGAASTGGRGGGAPGTGGTISEAGGSNAGGSGKGGTSAGGGGASGKAGTTTGAGGSGKGGATTGAGGAGSGGATADASITEAGSTGDDCAMGTWPTADPSVAGPFATVTEQNVGPEAGLALDGGVVPDFTLFRPKDMMQGGLCHPVITWGNGTSSTPSIYKVLLNHLASHGFVVIASNSTNVAQGNPAPMVVGVTWVLQQNDDPTSVMYHRIDTTHIGATGHSQGAFATTQAAGDSHITTMAPLCGASTQRNLHGPAMIYCGGADTTVPCSTVKGAFDAITTLPAMLAEYVSADHANWITFTGTKPGPVEVAVTAWMRVHLMDDSALRSWFYGASCKLCTDSAWQITQKNMDQ